MNFLRGWLATTGLGNQHDLNDSSTWECVRDPSGVFLGRIFKWLDIETSLEMKTWPEGIEFRDQRSGRHLCYTAGSLVDVRTGRSNWVLRLDGRIIYTSSSRRVSASLLRKYGIQEDEINHLDVVETNQGKLEWSQQ